MKGRVIKYFLSSILTIMFPFCSAYTLTTATTNALTTAQPPDQQISSAPESDIEFAVEPENPVLINYQLEAILAQKPSPLLIDGKAYLAYELFVTNVGNPTFKIIRVDLVDADHPDKVLVSYSEDQLLDMIRSFQLTDPDSDQSLVLRPGIKEVLFFMPGFKNMKDVPHKLIHKFILQIPGFASNRNQQNPQPFTTVTVPVEVDLSAPVVLVAPLHGEHWLAANGPSNTSIHRRARITNHGTMYFPERFAIDFMQFGPNGKAYKNSPTKNENYYGYGANIYSVATGKVVVVYDGIPDNTPGNRDYPINLGNMAGNFVLIDIGNKHYAFYAHLIPNSIKVKRGDIVMKGELIGKLGNSGNSDAPHLHFHIVDRASALSAQGLPYGFEHFTTEQYKISNPDSDPILIYSGHRLSHKAELVPENAIINFEGK